MTSSSPVENTRHARPARHRAACAAPTDGGQPQRLRRQARAARQHGGAARDVFAARGGSTAPRRGTRCRCATRVVQRRRTASCITTASAPGGTCAPVKMRAAVPGLERRADDAGRDALATGSTVAGAPGRRRSAPRSRPSRCCPAAARRAARRTSGGQHAAVGIEGRDGLVSADGLGAAEQARQRFVDASAAVDGLVVVALMAHRDALSRICDRAGVIQIEHRQRGRLRQSRPGCRWRPRSTFGSCGYMRRLAGLPGTPDLDASAGRPSLLKPSTSTRSQARQLGQQLVERSPAAAVVLASSAPSAAVEAITTCAGARLAMPLGVLARLVDVEAVVRMLDAETR